MRPRSAWEREARSIPVQKAPGTPVTSTTATSGAAPARAMRPQNSSGIACVMAPGLSGRSMVTAAMRSAASWRIPLQGPLPSSPASAAVPC